MAEVAVAFPAVADSIPRARDAVDRLGGTVDAARLDDLRLVVSELVTNSVRHAKLDALDRIELRVRVDARRIRAELRDGGRGFVPPPRQASLFQESGWGLYLVDQLADRWGIESDPRGTTVWVEIDR